MATFERDLSIPAAVEDFRNLFRQIRPLKVADGLVGKSHFCAAFLRGTLQQSCFAFSQCKLLSFTSYDKDH
jgi:hypothetical protein